MTKNYQQAVQDAAFAALNVAACTSIGPVKQHLLEQAQPPYFLIGDISLSPIGGKDSDFFMARLAIWTYSRQPNRTQLYSMMAAVRSLLGHQNITAAGYILSELIETKTEDSLLGDGQTYFGMQEFELSVQ